MSQTRITGRRRGGLAVHGDSSTSGRGEEQRRGLAHYSRGVRIALPPGVFRDSAVKNLTAERQKPQRSWPISLRRLA